MEYDKNGLHLHQSDIETFLGCPEQLRFGQLPGPEFESDAAVVGTALHAVINTEVGHGPFDSLADAQGFAIGWYGQEMVRHQEEGVIYSRETFGDDRKALASLMTLVEAWWWCDERQTLAKESDVLTEWPFDLKFLDVHVKGRKNPIPVWLSGTSDIKVRNEVWDWKSASGPYQKWEKQRWAIQPTVYTWAATQMGLIVPDHHGEFKFVYKVFVRSSKPTQPISYEIKRSQGSFDWLGEVVTNMVTLMAKMPDGPWPLNDHSALCGPKWCPFWSACKGKHVSKETWT